MEFGCGERDDSCAQSNHAGKEGGRENKKTRDEGKRQQSDQGLDRRTTN